ncbi:hypothetical protein B0H17DRAFT_1190466 [Mycena rosella]|uniref:Uncharacterized protein n=1 Tax=Mycena rosella TaxID=1033263 RepID=A0AAD7MCM4_MYCRO|nr:hypothetical protein B0H17DRAFT_1190466 [Mycena rosella]
MSWKWADYATKHQLRIEGWPAQLKATFPSPGFDLANLKDAKALGGMIDETKKRYLGGEDKVRLIVSWTEEERELDLEDMLTVLLVNQNRNKGQKHKRITPATEVSEDEQDKDPSDAEPAPVKTKAANPPPVKRPRLSKLMDSNAGAVSTSNVPSVPTASGSGTPTALTCRYTHDRETSEPFAALKIARYGESRREFSGRRRS